MFGQDWLESITLDWSEIHCQQNDPLHSLLDQCTDLINMKGFKAKFYTDKTVRPKCCKARSVPYAMQTKVEDELDILIKEGIIEPVYIMPNGLHQFFLLINP